MTSLSVIGFKGEIPRLAAHLLPNSNAQSAINCNLRSGDLVPLLGPTVIQNFSGGPYKTIYWLNNQIWLKWTTVVDVALSPILGDVTNRYYFTGTDVPRISNYDLSTALAVDYTTEEVVIPGTGAYIDVTVSNGAQFTRGETIRLNDGTTYVFGTIFAVAGNDLTIVITSLGYGQNGDTLEMYAIVTVPNTGIDYPYFSYKLGSPQPLNAPTVDYDFSNFTISYLDPCSALTTSSVTATTVADFTIVAAGLTQTVDIDNASALVVGNVVDINNGTDEITGVITAIVGNSLTVQTVQIVSGTAGDDMTSGATLTVSFFTVFTPTGDGSVTIDAGIGNPAPSFNINSATGALPIYVYRDFNALDIPVSMAQFDFYFDYSAGHAGSIIVVAGASQDGTGNTFEAYIDNGTVASTVTTATFVVTNDNVSVNINVASAPFSIGGSIVVDDGGGHAMQGTITAINGLILTVLTTVVMLGAPGNTMGSAATVTTADGLLKWGVASAWAAPNQTTASQAMAMVFQQWYRLQVFYAGESATGFNYIVRLINGQHPTTPPLYVIPLSLSTGPSGSFIGWNRLLEGITHIDNLGAQDFVTQGSEVLTSYVFTYMTLMGEESAPSPISNEQVTADAISKVVTLPPIPGAGEQTAYGTNFVADYGIIGRRLYRAVTVGTTSSYLLVADETVLTLSVDSFTDTQADSALSVELPSDGWLLPPADGHSILTLSNGIVCMASGNQGCLAPVGAAHAYPLTQRFGTPKAIVKMGTIDTTIVATTKGFPYISSGTDPASYTDATLERAYACVSAPGLTYLATYGVVYPAQVGLVAVNGSSLRNLTDAYFTMQDWQTLVNPSSIVATVWDDLVIGYCQPLDGTVRGFIFDPSGAEGQAWSWFDLSPGLNWDQVPAGGFYDDPLSGNIYMIRNAELDTFATGAALVNLWQSKQWQLDFPQSFPMAKVHPQKGYIAAATPITVTLNLTDSNDNTFSWPTVVQNSRPFTNRPYVGQDVNFQVSGAWGVKQVDFSTNLEETI